MAVADGGQGITLRRPGKGEPAEKLTVRFTDRTRLAFDNVARDGARIPSSGAQE